MSTRVTEAVVLTKILHDLSSPPRPVFTNQESFFWHLKFSHIDVLSLSWNTKENFFTTSLPSLYMCIISCFVWSSVVAATSCVIFLALYNKLTPTENAAFQENFWLSKQVFS